jgi:hypothetical protein
MRKLILILALALLLCGCVDGATKIGLDRLNWSQSNLGNIDVGRDTDYDAAFYDFVCDGIADNVQIQQALYLASNLDRPKVVTIHPGSYSISTAGMIVPPGVTVEGANWPHPSYTGFDGEINKRTLFNVTYGEGTTNLAAMQLQSGSSISNIAFYYPNQDGALGEHTVLTYGPSIDLTYNATIVGYAHNVKIKNIDLGNTYFGINSEHAHSLKISDVVGAPLKNGIYYNDSQDFAYIENCQFNPWYSKLNIGTGNGYNLAQYARNNLEAFHVKNATGAILESNYVYACKIGFKIEDSGTFPKVVNNGIDYASQYGIYVDDCYSCLIDGNYIVAANESTNTHGSIGILVTDSSGVHIDNNEIRAAGVALQISGSSKRCSVTNNYADRANYDNTTGYLFYAASPAEDITMTGNTLYGIGYSGTGGIAYNAKNASIALNQINVHGTAIYFGGTNAQIFGNFIRKALTGVNTADGSGTIRRDAADLIIAT